MLSLNNKMENVDQLPPPLVGVHCPHTADNRTGRTEFSCCFAAARIGGPYCGEVYTEVYTVVNTELW